MKVWNELQSTESKSNSLTDNQSPLIDLFVDMCFANIHNPLVILQFKIVAQQLDYPTQEIDEVIKLGKLEYSQFISNLE